MKPAYDRDGITLYHGDSRVVLEDLLGGGMRADLILTDPPYGMTYVSKSGASLRGDSQRQGIRLLRQVIGLMSDALLDDRHAYMFCHWESWPDFYDCAASYLNVKNALIWHKAESGTGDTEGDFAHNYEMVMYAHKGRRALRGRRDGSVLKVPTLPGSGRVHPTEKPTQLLRYLIEKSSEPGEMVLDPFAGSASTLRAARELGRRAIGIEVNGEYLEGAIRSLEMPVTSDLFGGAA